MTSAVNKILEMYNYIFTELADPRTTNFFLLDSPWPVLSLTGMYLYFCTTLGPRYMKDKNPYNLKIVILAYNVYQVCMSAYLFYEGFVYMSSHNFKFRCAPVDFSEDPAAVRVASGVWWYFFTKLTEFLDTIFFVLKKKSSHISFLHVYHHSLMALMMWFGAKYLPGGNGIVMGTLNSFVHVVMYTYYLIAGLGPKYQQYTWWKKHVTVLQLVQFVIIFVHSLSALFSDCAFPKIPSILICLNSVLFLILFGKFYYANYINGSNKDGSVKNESIKNGTDKNGCSKNGSVQNGSNKNGSFKNEFGKSESVKEEHLKNGTCTNELINKYLVNENRMDKCKTGLNRKHKDI